LTPPLIWSALHRLRSSPQPTFASWEDAAAAAGAYSDKLANEFRVARAARGAEAGWLPDPLATPLAWLCAMFPGHLEITDFGGATGELGVAVGQIRPNIAYTVVENPTLVSLMAPRDSVRFTSDLPEKCDIFYSSGTLQYLPDPYKAFETGAKSAQLALVLSRNCFCDRDIFKVQTSPLYDNGGGPLPDLPDALISWPHRTVSEAKIQVIAASHGFRLVSRTPGQIGVPYGYEGYDVGLVFLKA
jgi:putative methyltransferase (TIGR04325 family)